MCNRQPLQSFSKGLIWVDIISSKATRRPAIWKVTSHFWLWAIEIVFHRQSIIADGRVGASRSKGPEFQSRSGSYESALQKNNLFDITVVAEDHEPSKGIVWEPLIGSGCRALYLACRAWVKPWFRGYIYPSKPIWIQAPNQSLP